jgi:hypothetical protein
VSSAYIDPCHFDWAGAAIRGLCMTFLRHPVDRHFCSADTMYNTNQKWLVG